MKKVFSYIEQYQMIKPDDRVIVGLSGGVDSVGLLSQNPDALLEHNTFYVRTGVPFVRTRMDGGNYTEKDDKIIPIP